MNLTKKKKRHCLHGIFSLWFKNKILPFLNRPCFSKYLFQLNNVIAKYKNSPPSLKLMLLKQCVGKNIFKISESVLLSFDLYLSCP